MFEYPYGSQNLVLCFYMTELTTMHATCRILFEPRDEKTCLRGLRPGKTETSLFSYRDWPRS